MFVECIKKWFEKKLKAETMVTVFFIINIAVDRHRGISLQSIYSHFFKATETTPSIKLGLLILAQTIYKQPGEKLMVFNENNSV